MAVGDEQRLAGARASEFIVIHSVERKIPVCGGRTRRASLHAGGYTQRGGEGGEHGDDKLNEFAPNGRFVGFHRF